jgi:cation:H+ antiporter
MLLSILIFTIGLAFLTVGAKILVDGASRIALALGVSPLVVGMSIIAFGTSMPEFVFNLTSSTTDANDLAIGNIVGSNIANIALILGITGILKPVRISSSIIRKEYLFMTLTGFMFFALAIDGEISRTDGGILAVIFIGFLYWLFKSGKVAEDAEIFSIIPKPKPEFIKNGLFILGGLAGLIYGADLMVESAITIALSLGVSEMVIGVTIVAIGTSLPELAASVAAIIRKENDISLGNILGSNIFNVLFVVGFVSIFSPLSVTDIWTLPFHMPYMLAVVLMIIPLYFLFKSINRTGGIVMLIVYAIYLFFCYRISVTGGL